MTTYGSRPKWSTDDQAFGRTVTELLEAGQYKRLAEFLRRVRAAYDRQEDAIPAQKLDLARRICLACSQSQAEAAWHQQARDEAVQREEQLRHQLNALLSLAGERDQIPVAPGVPERAVPISIRQRLRDLLHQGLGPQPPARAAPEVPVLSVEAPTSTPEGPEHEAVPATPAEAKVDDPSPPSSPPEPQDISGAVPHAEPEQREEPVPPASPLEHEDSLGASSAPSVNEEQKEPAAQPSLVIHSLGPFRVYNSLDLIENWPGQKCKSLFKYLIFHRRNPVHREVLMELFWPDAGPEAAGRNLYQAIYSLRKVLKASGIVFPYILCEDSCYGLNPDVKLWIDSEAFVSHHQRGHQLERAGRPQEAVREYELADSLYEGEFLCEDRYEDWPVLERENLKHKHLDVLDRLSRFYFEQAHFNMCITFCQKILAEDDCREDIHRRLMRCFFNCDQVHLAIRQYHLCVDTLKRELDVPPMPATVELYQQIWSSRVQIQSA